MNKILNRQAFFADGTPFYRLYTSDGTGYSVRLRFRTAKDNAELVTVVTDSMKADMHKCFTEGRFDYYEVMLHYPECGTNYYFTVTGAETDEGKRTAVYNKRGVMDGVQDYYNFNFYPEFKTPDWAKGAVFYQIFVDRFYNGDSSNDVLTNEYFYISGHSRRIEDWSKIPDNALSTPIAVRIAPISMLPRSTGKPCTCRNAQPSALFSNSSFLPMK